VRYLPAARPGGLYKFGWHSVVTAALSPAETGPTGIVLGPLTHEPATPTPPVYAEQITVLEAVEHDPNCPLPGTLVQVTGPGQISHVIEQLPPSPHGGLCGGVYSGLLVTTQSQLPPTG